MEANIKINTLQQNEIDNKIYGQFIEDIETCINGGIHDQGNPLSNAEGIRLDVLDKAKELNPNILRFPGGTVINIYHWKDYIGPISQRPKRRNYIWGGYMNTQFGIAEFVKYCRELNCEPMVCVNMATGTCEEAAQLVEYCNSDDDSYYACLRRSHGYKEPFNIKYWCIGNESYANLDLGSQDDPDVYIRDGWNFTKYMKLVDENIKLVFCGAPNKPEWNKKILDAFNEVCDYFSIHFYAHSNNEDMYQTFDSINTFNNSYKELEKLIESYPKTVQNFPCFYRFKPRQEPIKICCDEWNIWNNVPSQEAGRYGLRCTYNWRDALWVGCFMNTIHEHSDTLKITTMAQMVNVIAPIKTNSQGSIRQTIFYPFQYFRKYAGKYNLGIETNSPIINEQYNLHAISASAVINEDNLYLFVVNISNSDININIEGLSDYKFNGATLIESDDLKTENTFNNPDNVHISEIAHLDNYSSKALSITIFRFKK